MYANKLDDVPRDVPTRIAVGVARPSAQGQETTWKKKERRQNNYFQLTSDTKYIKLTS